MESEIGLSIFDTLGQEIILFLLIYFIELSNRRHRVVFLEW